MVTSDQYKIGTDAWKYVRMLEERRGHNYQYPNDKEWEKLLESGYEVHQFKNDRCTSSEYAAKEVVEEYRKNGYYSRIVCFPQGKIIMREFTVIFKKRKQ
jgi:hypothetical protein